MERRTDRYWAGCHQTWWSSKCWWEAWNRQVDWQEAEGCVSLSELSECFLYQHVLTSMLLCRNWQARYSWQVNNMRMWQRLEYTTILVLLHLHADTNLFGLIFRSERRNMVRVCNMRWLQNALGPQICNLLLFAHAIAGCDIKPHLFLVLGRV